MTIADVQIDEKTLGEICRRFHVRKLAVFGSTVKGDARADSDVDLLIEFDEENTPDYFTLYELEKELSKLFGGKVVDLVSERSLHWFIRDEVLAHAQVRYEEGR
jgi:predicted nucleotidyltransferase